MVSENPPFDALLHRGRRPLSKAKTSLSSNFDTPFLTSSLAALRHWTNLLGKCRDTVGCIDDGRLCLVLEVNRNLLGPHLRAEPGESCAWKLSALRWATLITPMLYRTRTKCNNHWYKPDSTTSNHIDHGLDNNRHGEYGGWKKKIQPLGETRGANTLIPTSNNTLCYNQSRGFLFWFSIFYSSTYPILSSLLMKTPPDVARKCDHVYRLGAAFTRTWHTLTSLLVYFLSAVKHPGTAPTMRCFASNELLNIPSSSITSAQILNPPNLHWFWLYL